MVDFQYRVAMDTDQLIHSPAAVGQPSSHLIELTTPRPASTEAAKTVVSRPTARQRVALMDVWREAVVVLGAYPQAILAIATVTFASLSMAAQAVGSLTHPPPGSDLWLSVTLALLGLLLHAFGQGALAWIGLRGTWSCAHMAAGLTMRQAFRAALQRWPALLPGPLLHSAVTFACALGFTPLLLSTGQAVLTRAPFALNLVAVPRLVVSDGLDAVVLGPAHPLAVLVTPTRRSVLQRAAARPRPDVPGAPVMNRWYVQDHLDVDVRLPNDGATDDAVPPAWPLALVSLVVLITAETALRFGPAAVMQLTRPTRGLRGGVFPPLCVSVRLSIRYFLPVTAGVWALRLVVSALQIACVILSAAQAENLVLLRVSALLGMPWIGPVCQLLCAVGGALVSAILAAVATLYGARLFAALRRAEQGG